jgi:hypothetical protein
MAKPGISGMFTPFRGLGVENRHKGAKAKSANKKTDFFLKRTKKLYFCEPKSFN